MARKNRRLARTALVLAATTVTQAVVQKIADDPKLLRKVKRKAKTVVGSAGKVLKRAGKKLARTVKGRGKAKPAPKRAARRKKAGARR